MDHSQGRLLNVSLLAGSGAHRAYYDRSGSSVSELTADELAAAFPPRPALNLRSKPRITGRAGKRRSLTWNLSAKNARLARLTPLGR
jgi:hypothetical protein